ncbi:hypothetical protein AOLI_G00034950 [Acnodon oligacanthus]
MAIDQSSENLLFPSTMAPGKVIQHGLLPPVRGILAVAMPTLELVELLLLLLLLLLGLWSVLIFTPGDSLHHPASNSRRWRLAFLMNMLAQACLESELAQTQALIRQKKSDADCTFPN